MITTAKDVLRAALQLPPKSRAAIAEKLVKSLRKPDGKGVKQIKMTEGLRLVIEQAEKDWQAYKRGEMKTYTNEEVFRSVRRKLKNS